MSKKYQVILIDPPWDFEVYNRDTGSGRSPISHYPVMSLKDIKEIPVPDYADSNCALFCWTVWPRLFDPKELFDHWGFSYKTLAFEWWKLNKNWHNQFLPMMLSLGDHSFLERLFFMGMGYYSRANSEPCLLAVKGNMPVQDRGQRNYIIAPIREHSRKPDEQYSKIEALYPDRDYLEMFARHKRSEHWDYWGNEVESDIDLWIPDKITLS